MKIEFTLVLMCATVHSLNDAKDDSRKNFGLNTYNLCKNYVKSFKCMSACKSIGFQLFRMDRKCKCTCYGMKTSTILPFFKWRTNGTTRKVPRTYSPRLYHIVGSLSPPTVHVEVETTGGVTSPEVKAATEATTKADEPTIAGNVTGGKAATTGAAAAAASSAATVAPAAPA